MLLFYKGRYRHIRKKNKGELALFNFLTYALQGILYKDFIPKYLKGKGSASDNSTEYDAFIQKLPALNSGIRYNSTDNITISNPLASDSIEYAFILPISNINTNVDEIKKLILCDSKDNECATINLSGESAINKNAAGTSNILIYWRLTFASSGNDIEELEEDAQNNIVEQIS